MSLIMKDVKSSDKVERKAMATYRKNYTKFIELIIVLLLICLVMVVV